MASRASPSACGSCWRRFEGSWTSHEPLAVITRRTFLGTLAGGLLAAPLAAEAQEAGKVWRIGLLSADSIELDKPYRAAFQEGLRELQYVEGRNVVIEQRYA